MGKFKENEEAYKEQICSMRGEGKSYADIKQFFKDTYSIKLWDSEIARICKKGNVSKSSGRTSGKRHKRSSPQGVAVRDDCKFKVICKFAEICLPGICKFKGA